jgi:crotonobetainyl-CoA:carnitine CoA-transferase CaiB-like acyl-CoA transferase
MVLELESSDGERVKVLGDPIIFRGEPRPENSYPPAVGQDTDAVLAHEFGMGEETIRRLRRDGVVGVKAREEVAK